MTPTQSRRYGRMVRDFTSDEAKAYNDHLLAGKRAEDFFAKMEKHLAGQHDQSSHGSWAGETVSELTDDEIRELIYTTDSVEHAFQKIAKRLGKSMKPKVADTVKVAGTPVYRGVQSVTRDAQRLLDGKIRYSEGHTYGQGIYVTEETSFARNYGTLIYMKLDDSAKMLRGEAEWDNSFKFDYENPNGRTRSTTSSKFLDLNKIKMKKWAPADIRNLYLASKGYDGVQIYSEILLFNADKLTVNEEDIGEAIRKHLAGQHDQSSHGSWATGNGAQFKPNNLSGTPKTFKGSSDWSDLQPTDAPDDQNIEMGSGLALDSGALKSIGQGKVFTDKQEINDYMESVFTKYGYGDRVFSLHPDTTGQYLVDGIEAGVTRGDVSPDTHPLYGGAIPVMIYKPSGVSQFVLLHEMSHILEGNWKVATQNGGHNLPFLETWKHLLRNEGLDKQANLLDVFTYRTDGKGVFE